MHTFTPENSIFDGRITDLLSILPILIEIVSRAHAEGEKSLNNFKFGTFIGCFPSDDVASMALKGLSQLRPVKMMFVNLKDEGYIYIEICSAMDTAAKGGRHRTSRRPGTQCGSCSCIRPGGGPGPWGIPCEC